MSLPTHPLMLSESWFDRLGIGLIIISGSVIARASKAALQLLGEGTNEVIGSNLLQLLKTSQPTKLEAWLTEIYSNANLTDPLIIDSSARLAHRIILTAEPLGEDPKNSRVIAIEERPVHDVRSGESPEHELLNRYSELTELNLKLVSANKQIQEAQNQLVQSEKLASIGQLAAGVAHEINNPIGYVFSNFGTLEHYLADLLGLIDAYRAAEQKISDPVVHQQLVTMRERVDLDFLRSDTLSLMQESREGIERVRRIVQDLKDFSHVDASAEWQWADIHRGLDSTLNVASNEIKYRARVIREFGLVPPIHCLPSQLNQVFMNLLVNAAHAMERQEGDADGAKMGTLTIRTSSGNDVVWVEISDTGCGMTPETMSKIFDPFFTTKPIGKGTGLGLSLSYGIVQKHHGKIEVTSTLGVGTTFRIVLPIQHVPMMEAAA